MLIVIDVCGSMDLDLNSSRTQIIMSEKWQKLEDILAFEICSGIANLVSTEYWNKLVELLNNNTKNEIFIESLSRVEKADVDVN